MKTILVLDDELLLLSFLCRLLWRNGYRTLEAGTAKEALGRCHEDPCQIDLLIADVSLPVGSGIQVALALRASRPDLPVILASGYPANAWTVRDSALLGRLGPDTVSILQKPFTPQALLNAISEAIGAGQLEAAGTPL